MRIQLKKKHKLNNAGMTLVEILIAMAILSVALVPLMYSFVNMARYNMRAREVQQTTVLAQTVIENCKAYSYEEIEDQITGSSFSFIDNINGPTAKVGDSFYISKVKAENQFYDVVLSVNAYERLVDDGAGGSAIMTSYDMMELNSMNPSLDAIFTVKTESWDDPGTTDIESGTFAESLDYEMYNAALQDISDKMALQAEAALEAFKLSGTIDEKLTVIEDVYLSIDDVKTELGSDFEMYRDIAIDITQSGTTEKVWVTYTYKYKVAGGSFTHIFTVTDPMGEVADGYLTSNLDCTGEILVGSHKFLIYSNEASYADAHKTHVDNIYFFYYPAYDTISGSTVASQPYAYKGDVITINNGLSRTDLNLHLVKQKNLLFSDADLSILDEAYNPTITGSGVLTNVYHNLYDNVVDGTSTANVVSFVDPLKPVVTYNMYSVEHKDTMYSMETDKELMYTVVVDVYKSGALQTDGAGNVSLDTGKSPVLSMDGTFLDW